MIAIKQLNNSRNGVLKALENERVIGAMTYHWSDQGQMSIDGTEVDPDQGGRGIGKKLINSAVESARKDGFKIVAICPFAKALFEKESEIQDVWSR